jgi:hypothetical protein
MKNTQRTLMKRKEEIVHFKKGVMGNEVRTGRLILSTYPKMNCFFTYHETVGALKTRRLPVQTVRELETENKKRK